MYLLIILTALLVGLTVALKKLHWSSNWKLPLAAVALFSGIGVLLMLNMLGIAHGTANSVIAQYEVVKLTIEASREDEMAESERATLKQTIIETNKVIARNKYWNETSFGIFVPDKLAELEYLK